MLKIGDSIKLLVSDSVGPLNCYLTDLDIAVAHGAIENPKIFIRSRLRLIICPAPRQATLMNRINNPTHPLAG